VLLIINGPSPQPRKKRLPEQQVALRRSNGRNHVSQFQITYLRGSDAKARLPPRGTPSNASVIQAASLDKACCLLQAEVAYISLQTAGQARGATYVRGRG
jgi:hypothetical protein